ncbi:MAG: hypothetical protein V2G48_00250 [bacterium JZ-2024 1]
MFMRFSALFLFTLAGFSLFLILSACEGPARQIPPPALHGNFLFLTTTDFQSGSFSVYAEEQGLMSSGYPPIHPDATAVFHSDKIFVLNRFGADQIQILDPKNHFRTEKQFSTNTENCPQLSNPYHLTFVSSDEAILSRYNCTSLLFLNPLTATILAEIDLSAFADSDGIPEMAYGFLFGETYFQALQKLTNWNPTNISSLLMVTPATRNIQGEIPLQGRNPTTEWVEFLPGKFAGAVVGQYATPDGGVEIVDAQQKRTLGIALSEEEIQGEVWGIAGKDGEIFLTVSSFGCNDFDPQTPCSSRLISWRPGLGIQELLRTQGVLGHIALSVGGNLLYVADRSLSGGLRIFSLVDKREITPSPIPTGLPPFWLTPFRL